jgi:hypothetical protein
VQGNLQERADIVAFHSQRLQLLQEVLALELQGEQEAPLPQLAVVLLFQVELKVVLLQVVQAQL